MRVYERRLQGNGGIEPISGEGMRRQRMEEERRRRDMRQQANCLSSLNSVFKPGLIQTDSDQVAQEF